LSSFPFFLVSSKTTRLLFCFLFSLTLSLFATTDYKVGLSSANAIDTVELPAINMNQTVNMKLAFLGTYRIHEPKPIVVTSAKNC